jgi:hypothetical protein
MVRISARAPTILLRDFHCGEDSSRGLLGCDAVGYQRFRRLCCLRFQGELHRNTGIPPHHYTTSQPIIVQFDCSEVFVRFLKPFARVLSSAISQGTIQSYPVHLSSSGNIPHLVVRKIIISVEAALLLLLLLRTLVVGVPITLYILIREGAVLVKMQDRITIHWLLTNPLKMWQSSSIWKQQQQIKISFTKKLRAD